MKRIALIVPKLNGGGAERVTADLSVFFETKGYEVYIFTNTMESVTYEYGGKLVPFSCNMSCIGDAERKNEFSCKVNELLHLKEQYKIDVAISFMEIANYINVLSKKHEKVILTTHSVIVDYSKYKDAIEWKDEVFAELYQEADCITFPSEYCRETWVKKYGDKNGITKLVYNPIHEFDLEDVVDNPRNIIAIGRLEPVKRQWHIIKAFKLLHDKYSDSRLVILGDGILRTTLEQMVEDYNLQEYVDMPGNVKDVAQYLAQARVFVIASRVEAMSCSVLEAMCAGVPVVAGDMPGGIREQLGVSKESVEEIIIGDYGILVPQLVEKSEVIDNDITEGDKKLAEALSRLLQDDELYNKMKQNIPCQIQKFLIEDIGNTWIDIIENTRNINRLSLETIKQKYLTQNVMYSQNNSQKQSRDTSYFHLFEKWMRIKERKTNLVSYFEDNAYHTIIIYGMAVVAQHLLEDIGGSEIRIVCGIDRSLVNKFAKFPIISPTMEIPSADCIVVTPVFDFESIKESLVMKTDIPIVSLTEIVEWKLEKLNR